MLSNPITATCRVNLKAWMQAPPGWSHPCPVPPRPWQWLPVTLRDVFDSWAGHAKFSSVICVRLCYLIGADGGLTLPLILLHHRVGTCGGCKVTVLLLSLTLEATNVQIDEC